MSTHYAVVLAGGRGTRFWPLSTPERPKQCLPLSPDGRSLLRVTIDRIRPLFSPEQILVITGVAMAEAVRACVPDLPDSNVLVEPVGRNTAPALIWASAEVRKRGGQSLVSVHADHLIADEAGFRQAMEAAKQATVGEDLVLLGMRPTHAHTGFGYIVPGEGKGPVYPVQRFTEKPSHALALQLIDQGALWNAGLFAWRLDSFARELAACLPEAVPGLERLVQGAAIDEVWSTLPRVSIDRGVLERSARVCVVPCDVGWSDVGSWDAADQWLPEHDIGRAAVACGLAIEGGDHVVYAPGKTVATLGVSGLIIVDTGDTLMITTRALAQRVGELASALKDRD